MVWGAWEAEWFEGSRVVVCVGVAVLRVVCTQKTGRVWRGVERDHLYTAHTSKTNKPMDVDE